MQDQVKWGNEVLPIVLRPGIAHSIRLLPGNPWEDHEKDDAKADIDCLKAVPLQVGQEFPHFQVCSAASILDTTQHEENSCIKMMLSFSQP